MYVVNMMQNQFIPQTTRNMESVDHITVLAKLR